jgi:hypothetical protein
MKYQQLIRIDKIYNESLYLLNIEIYDNKYEFKICGSTKNIYKINIYKYSKTIFCNCPDGKSYAKKNGVICKHCCFVIMKVLKVPNIEEFFNILLFNDVQMEYINAKINSLEYVENDFINLEYIDKFKNLKTKTTHIIVKKEHETLCPICYDELIDMENKQINNQCTCCHKIYHNKCINKWLNMGNNTCPYCRSEFKSKDNCYDSLD